MIKYRICWRANCAIAAGDSGSSLPVFNSPHAVVKVADELTNAPPLTFWVEVVEVEEKEDNYD